MVNKDMSPPKNRVVNNTVMRVLLTRSPALGDIKGLIYRERAKAIAPLMLPLNQRRVSYLILRENLIFLQGAINRAGKKTPISLLKMQENRTAIIKVYENLPDSLEYIESPR